VGAPPYPDLHPQAGTVSEPLELEFDGIEYTAVGYRSQDGMICSALVNPAFERVEGGVGCASARLLQRSLEERRFFVSGGGGGRHAIVYGFARPDVAGLALAAASRAASSSFRSPWRPGARGADSFLLRRQRGAGGRSGTADRRARHRDPAVARPARRISVRASSSGTSASSRG
jgi:hypothetical protein